MAGTVKHLHTFDNIDATTTVSIAGAGAHSGAAFYIDVTGVSRTTGTFTCAAVWKTIDGVSVTLATSAALSATGVAKLVNGAGLFDNATTATNVVPEPNALTITITGDTINIAGKVYAMYPN